MSYETINFSLQDGVATVQMNRPALRNALNSKMRAEITTALTTLSDEARVVVLTGVGEAFCSGQDLTDATSALDIEGTLRGEYEPMLRAITDCPVPVIAAVNGVAAGAGANLALVADVVIATRSAAFIEAFTRIGLVPDAGGTWIIPRLIGNARALGMMLFADSISADQAADWGLIWESVDDADFEAHISARAAHLAAGPSGAYRAIRGAVAASHANDLNAQLDLEAKLQGQAGRSADFREGVMAFLEKRRPKFTGR